MTSARQTSLLSPGAYLKLLLVEISCAPGCLKRLVECLVVIFARCLPLSGSRSHAKLHIIPCLVPLCLKLKEDWEWCVLDLSGNHGLSWRMDSWEESEMMMEHLWVKLCYLFKIFHLKFISRVFLSWPWWSWVLAWQQVIEIRKSHFKQLLNTFLGATYLGARAAKKSLPKTFPENVVKFFHFKE